jgi:hypothetical protein
MFIFADSYRDKDELCWGSKRIRRLGCRDDVTERGRKFIEFYTTIRKNTRPVATHGRSTSESNEAPSDSLPRPGGWRLAPNPSAGAASTTIGGALVAASTLRRNYSNAAPPTPRLQVPAASSPAPLLRRHASSADPPTPRLQCLAPAPLLASFLRYPRPLAAGKKKIIRSYTLNRTHSRLMLCWI